MTLSAPNNPVEARGKASKRAESRLAAVRRSIGNNLYKPTFRGKITRDRHELMVGRDLHLRPSGYEQIRGEIRAPRNFSMLRDNRLIYCDFHADAQLH